MKKQAFNPYLPLSEYVPDGEPYVFDGRVYIYGSHDEAGGTMYCLSDYVSLSAPVEDLSDWRYEGVSYRRTQDPSNTEDKLQLWAPDVVKGRDGRYYLYYCFSFRPEIGVAVSDHPAGPFEFYGHVHYADGKVLDDHLPFDPAVFVDDDGKVYLYYGFAPKPVFHPDLPPITPSPAVGDSVARILEEMGLDVCGTHGTTAALAMLNDAVKKGGVMACNSVGGLSGAFIPVSEDEGMIAAAQSGDLTIEKLEAMTAVCSVGLDMVVLPGETPAEVISAIIADEAAIGMVNAKTTAVRAIPAIGKKAGEGLNFGGLLGEDPIMAVNLTASPKKFIDRGGRIPAPMQSLKN